MSQISSTIKNTNWIFSPFEDLLFISSAVVFTIAFFLLSFILPDGQIPLLVLILGILLSWTHTIAPALLLADKNFSGHLKDETLARTKNTLYRITIIIAAFYLLGLMTLLREESRKYFYYYLLALPLIHFYWNFIHYARQNFGLVNLYNRKFNIKNTYMWDNAFCLLSTAFVIPLLSVTVIFNFFQYTPPDWYDSVLLFLSYLTIVLGLPLLAKKNNSLGKQICILVIIVQPIIIYYSFSLYSLAALSFPHWFTEIYLVNRLQKNSVRNSTFKNRYNFLFIVMAVGLLFWFFTRFFIKSNSLDRLFVLIVPVQENWTLNSLYILNFIVAFIYAVPTIWHFYLDSVIYKGSSYKDPNFLAQAMNLKP